MIWEFKSKTAVKSKHDSYQSLFTLNHYKPSLLIVKNTVFLNNVSIVIDICWIRRIFIHVWRDLEIAEPV